MLPLLMTGEERIAIKKENIANLKSQASKQLLSYLVGVPDSYHYLILRAFVGNSKADSIKAKCLDCAQFDKLDITYCEADMCALHKHRPYQSKGEKE